MKKFSAIRLIKPSHGDSRRESMNMYRAVRGRLGNDKSRHLFDLYQELCRASKVRGKRFENIERTFGAVCVRCVLAGNAQAFRDLAEYIEDWPPPEAATDQDRFVSPEYVAALRFFHYHQGKFTRAQLRGWIKHETGLIPTESHLTDIINRLGKLDAVDKRSPAGRPPMRKTKRSPTKGHSKKK
jgi:hypothetical protein